MRARPFPLALIAAALCLLVVSVVGTSLTPLLNLDAALTNRFRARAGAVGVDAALLLTALGSTPFAIGVLTLVVLLLAIKQHWGDLLFILCAVGGGIPLNGELKRVFDRPRPLFESPLLAFDGNSFPSGHAMAATVLYGGLLMLMLERISSPVWRGCAATAAAVLIGVVAATRVFLGAHYVTDVVGGIAFGLLWVATCWYIVRSIVSRTSR